MGALTSHPDATYISARPSDVSGGIIARQEYAKVDINVGKDWFERIIVEAEIVYTRYPVKGVYPYLPYGAKLARNLEELVHERLEASGHEPIVFPSLIPLSLFKREVDFFEGFMPEALLASRKLSGEELEEPLVLRPTSEVPIYHVFAQLISSYRQLPLKVYQTVNVYRIETRATAPLLRLREVTLFNEAHVFCRSEGEARRIFEEAVELYRGIYDHLRIPYVIVKSPPWDLFPGAVENYDFITVLPDGKVLELASVINLGQKFARAFKVRFQDVDEEVKYAWQLCYGIGIDRMIAALVWLHGDSRGLVLHPDVAPIQVVVVAIPPEPELVEGARGAVASALSGYRVHVDDDTQRTPGWKFYYWEQRGVPVRVEVGRRELASSTLTLVDRVRFEKARVPLSSAAEEVERRMELVRGALWERAVTKVSEALRKRALLLDLDFDRGECEAVEEERGVSTLGKVVGSNFLPEECVGKMLFGKKY